MPIHSYITMLSIEECRSRLSDPRYSSPKFWTFTPFTFPPEGTIFVKLRGGKFRLFATGPKYINNSFAPFFYGSIETLPNGTRIQGRFRTHPVTRLFNAIWFGGLGFITLVIIISFISGKRQFQQPLHVVFGAPLLMLLFGIGFVRLCWWFGRDQRQTMQDFIQDNLQALPQTQF